MLYKKKTEKIEYNQRTYGRYRVYRSKYSARDPVPIKVSERRSNGGGSGFGFVTSPGETGGNGFSPGRKCAVRQVSLSLSIWCDVAVLFGTKQFPQDVFHN
jgi:hypothetical protein